VAEVHYDEGLANRIGPEPCVVGREAGGEASVGVRIGQVLSLENILWGADAIVPAEGNTVACVNGERATGPAWSQTLACAHAPRTETGRSRLWPSAYAGGPHREGAEPKPMKHEGEKSDPAIVAVKLANAVGQPDGERVERRAGAEENAGQDGTLRTPSRSGASHGLDRVRTAARLRKEERFTALLHHVDIDRLRDAFFALKREAVPGIDGMTWQDYGEGVEARLDDLCGRVHRGAYRAQPSRRQYIPKPDGRQRPLGIAALVERNRGSRGKVPSGTHYASYSRVVFQRP